jgi:dTDP-4-amino-4,6-dideoxygalactose transaminase
MGVEERNMLLDAFDSNWIAPLGPDVDAFERELSEMIHGGPSVALSSGTAALHLALLLNGVDPGDEVLVPTFTFVATANAVRYVGAEPVFVDCSPSTWTIDPDLVESELRERARHGRLPAALVTVDLYGQMADYDALVPLCEHYGIPLIEDAAEALGSTYRGRCAGTMGNAGVFSFNGNKIITTSGGGMLVLPSEDLADRARYLASQARLPYPHYEHTELGFNYRLSNLLAAIGRAQLRGLPRNIARRAHINANYRSALADLPGVTFMPIAEYGAPNYWLTCVSIDADRFGADREDVRRALEGEDIESRPTWKPLHLQPVFAKSRVVGGSVAGSIFDRGLCLPSGSALDADDQDRIVETFRSVRRSRST